MAVVSNVEFNDRTVGVTKAPEPAHGNPVGASLIACRSDYDVSMGYNHIAPHVERDDSTVFYGRDICAIFRHGQLPLEKPSTS